MTLARSFAEAERLCVEAMQALDDVDHPRSFTLLMQALSVDRTIANTHYVLGLYYGDTGQLGPALESYEAAIRLEPRFAKAHNNRGSILEQVGRLDEAERSFRRAMEIDPMLAAPYLNLGHSLEQRGLMEDAVAIYTRAIEHELDRDIFEQQLATLQGKITRASPASWVRATFDNFAPAFDHRLRSLGYRVPDDLAIIMRPWLGERIAMLDLGCGTGLSGLAFADRKSRLVGVDLSPRMLRQAELRGVYDELHTADIQDFARSTSSDQFDFVIAADVFVYLGALDALVAAVARILKLGGYFAFSTEERNVSDFTLLPTGRYAHSEAYLRRLTRPAFELRYSEPTTVRMEGTAPATGRLYVVQKLSPAFLSEARMAHV